MHIKFTNLFELIYEKKKILNTKTIDEILSIFQKREIIWS